MMAMLLRTPFLFPLLNLFIFQFPFSFSFYLPESNPLFLFRSQVREVHLYTDNHRRGIFLQINSDGRVTGGDARTLHSVLELKSVRPGYVVIKGKSSSLFLCMDNRGSLTGQAVYEESNCCFRELLLADGYTRFVGSHHGLPVSLSPRHSPDQTAVPFTRFLPLTNTLSVESEEPFKAQRNFDVDSEDLFGMGQSAVVSPHLYLEK